VEECRLNNLNC